MTIKETLSDDHRACDSFLSDAENAVASGDWVAAKEKFKQFQHAMTVHLSMEEDVLFPAFEEETGMTEGPTMVMRCEHTQMRELLQGLEQAIGEQSEDIFLGNAETLFILMQQHNMKEEQMLYPMTDDALDSGILLPKMAAQREALT